MPTITAYVIAYNEAEKIEAAVGGLLWADEVIVVDSHSTDDTAARAEALGAKVVQVEFDGFGKLRNDALEHCTGDWVFSLDADERCTAEARDEILRVVNDPQSADIYQVPRRNYFMGRWIRHSGWYPDYRQPQLFRRGALRYDLRRVHESWTAEPGMRVAKLKADIWQFPFRNIEQMQQKMVRYTTLGAQQLAAEGRRANAWTAASHAFWNFLGSYIFKLGFLDGFAGLTIAYYVGESSYYKYAKLREINKGWAPPEAERLE